MTPLDRALRARFMHLAVRADRGSWLSWAQHAQLHPAVISLAQTHDRILDDVPPRTWTYVSTVLQTLTQEETANDVLLRDVLGGYLPSAWLELILATRDRWNTSLGVDVRAMLAQYGGAAMETVRGYRTRGETDRLDEIAQRVLGVVKGPEIGVMAEAKQFSMTAFESLLADLPGDHRERIHEALARNPIAVAVAEVQPIEVLQGYPNSAAEQRIRAWRNDPARLHRIALVANALKLYLEQHPHPGDLRKSNAARIGLGHFLAQVPERVAMPVVETLLKLGITPVRPG